MEDFEIHDRLKHKLLAYRLSTAATELIRKTPILLLVGISGAGKGTIMDELIKKGTYHPVVTHTTRLPRANNGVMEQDGREYHFITLDEAEGMLDRGEYVEAMMYSGNVYGTSIAEIQMAHDTHQIVVNDIDIQGVTAYETIDPNVRAVFVLPPNYEEWQARLLHRSGGAVDWEDYKKRMATALQEIEHALHDPHFTFVVNDSLDEAVEEIDRIATGDAQWSEIESARQVAHSICEQLKLAHAA